MRKWLLRSMLAAAVGWAAVIPAGPAAAGGWAVVSFDSSPAVVAGEPSELGFTLLRHGLTPESSTDVTFVVTGSDGYRERFSAVPAGAPGHHVVTITVPTAGDYTWSAEGTFMPIALGRLSVAAERRSARGGASVGWEVVRWGGTGLAVLLAVAAAADASVTRRRRSAVSVSAEA